MEEDYRKYEEKHKEECNDNFNHNDVDNDSVSSDKKDGANDTLSISCLKQWKTMNKQGHETWSKIVAMIKSEYRIFRSTITQTMKKQFFGKFQLEFWLSLFDKSLKKCENLQICTRHRAKYVV